jgi:hypothetical protein
MKVWNGVLTGLALAGICALPSMAVDEREDVRDLIKIERTTASGAKVTVVEGTDAAAGEGFVEATRVTTNTVRVPVKTVTKFIEVPVEATPHKARLAVLPAIFSKHFQPVFKLSETIETSGLVNLKMIFTSEHESRMEAPSFTLSLAEAFVASRKFDVLERTRLNETLKEIDFGQSDYADAAKAVPMGKALNAEYVVLPEVEVIHLVMEVKDVPYVDTVQPKLKGKMIVRLRVADTASTRMVAASTEEVQVERKIKANNPFLATEINSLVMDLYKAASVRALQRTLEAIYPVRLLEVTEGKAVLNRGEGSISIGDEFEVYSLSKTYKDPDTGEMLGQRETKIAVIKVDRVAPKFSEAEILAGGDRLMGDTQGYLCRETAKSIEVKTKIEQTPMAW